MSYKFMLNYSFMNYIYPINKVVSLVKLVQ